MRAITLLRRLLALKQTRVTSFEITEWGLEIDVAPTSRVPYCSACMRRARHVYDHRLREWRHLDFAGMEVILKYQQRRVACLRCGEGVALILTDHRRDLREARSMTLSGSRTSWT
jgi:transposase